jgi:hypothetical protein
MLKPTGNSVEVHPQLSHNRLPMDGVLMAVGSLDGPSFLSPIISSKTIASSFAMLGLGQGLSHWIQLLEVLPY